MSTRENNRVGIRIVNNERYHMFYVIKVQISEIRLVPTTAFLFSLAQPMFLVPLVVGIQYLEACAERNKGLHEIAGSIPGLVIT
jgi:hypothetical protein